MSKPYRESTDHYTLKPFSNERLMVSDANRIGKKIPFIHSVWELDITEIRKKIRQVRKKHSTTLSLSTYFLYCFVVTINENKEVHAVKKGKRTLCIFDDVDVFFPIELNSGPIDPKVIRSVNKKEIFDLQNEIEASKLKAQVNIDLNKKVFLSLPRMVRYFFYDFFLMKIPTLRKNTFGTAYFTSLSMHTNSKGVGIPIPMHSIGMLMGTMEKKSRVVEGNTVIRDFMSITNSADHSIVDGAVLTRFVIRLKSNIENLMDAYL